MWTKSTSSLKKLISLPSQVAPAVKKLTILDEPVGEFILFIHQSEVESSTVPDFIVRVIQTPGEQNSNTPLDFRVLLADAKLGQRRNGSRPDKSVFQNDSVVDVTDVLRRLRGLGAFHTKQV